MDNLTSTITVITGAVTISSAAIGLYVKAKLAESENRLVSRLNGIYIRTSECKAQKDVTCQLQASISEEIEYNRHWRRWAGNVLVALGLKAGVDTSGMP